MKNITCITCGKEFETNVSTAKYCCDHCKFLYEYEHKEPLKSCVNCEKKFHFKNQKIEVCSKECSVEYHSKNAPNTYKEGVYNYSCTCVICGINFKSPSKKKYCSLDCEFFSKDVFAKKVFKKVCVNCGKEFETDKSQTVVCSDECKYERLHGAEKVRKTKETLIERFGEGYNKELGKLVQKTFMDKYGVNVYAKTDECKEKIKKTCLEKYGKESYLQTEEIKIKKRRFYLVNFGIDTIYATSVPEIRKKARKTFAKTFKEKYNGSYPSKLRIINFDKWNDYDFIKSKFIVDGKFDTVSFCDFFNVPYHRAMSKKYDMGYKDIPNINSCIKAQLSIYDWIKSFYEGDIISNYRGLEKELYIYIPEFNLAIEYNRLMFHSFGKSNHSMFHNYIYESRKKYHLLEKTELCESKGIKLFQIFENEWSNENKQEIWKSMVKVNLNKADIVINARDCEIREVIQKDCIEFLDKNHLQGSIKSPIAYGLYYNNELVQLLTFGKSRFNRNYDYELLRQCTKTYTVVRGGFSKLLKYFKSKHDGSVISYVNRRWTCSFSNVYGDKMLYTSTPNYFYFNDYYNPILYSRQKFQKNKIKQHLDNYEERLSETDNMYNNGYRKIFDCGNLAFEL